MTIHYLVTSCLVDHHPALDLKMLFGKSGCLLACSTVSPLVSSESSSLSDEWPSSSETAVSMHVAQLSLSNSSNAVANVVNESKPGVDFIKAMFNELSGIDCLY
jgi:hypothetical protein